MGVLHDYFRVADDAAAVDLMAATEGGPIAVGAESLVDAVDLKGIEPTVHLGQLIALARDVPWEPGLVESELIWSGDEEGPWLISIGSAARDALASISGGERLGVLSAAWGQTEELAWHGPLPGDQLVPVIEEIAGLARRARDAGERLYCWVSL